MNTIPLPERGITCLPPWPQAMAFSDKRLENRGYGVARQIGEWRGLLAVSQSKTWDEEIYRRSCDTAGIYSRLAPLLVGVDLFEWAGHIPLVAELMDVLPPERCEGDLWHVPGQWGLILGRVWLVEPVPCTGGVGAWRVEWCAYCGHVYADCARMPNKCYTCKRAYPFLGGDDPGVHPRPELKVIKECVI